MPTSCCGIATPPIAHGLVGNGPGRSCRSGDQIHAASPLRITNSAIVAMTTVSALARSNGRMTTRWIADAEEERDHERE